MFTFTQTGPSLCSQHSPRPANAVHIYSTHPPTKDRPLPPSPTPKSQPLKTSRPPPPQCSQPSCSSSSPDSASTPSSPSQTTTRVSSSGPSPLRHTRPPPQLVALPQQEPQPRCQHIARTLGHNYKASISRSGRNNAARRNQR